MNSLASDFDVDLYVTGSNSSMMSSEISTYLTGRYISFRIYTLSFSEYLMFKEKYDTIKVLDLSLQNYLQDEIYNLTIFSDIVRRNQIRKIDQLERVVKYVFQNVGNPFLQNQFPTI